MRKTIAFIAVVLSAGAAVAAGETAEYRPVEPKGFVPVTTVASVIEDTAFVASNPYPGAAEDLNIRISERRRNIDITSGASAGASQ